MITVLSVTNGFQADLTRRVLGLTSHIVALPLTGPYFEKPVETIAQILQTREVLAAAPGLSTQGLLIYMDGAKSVQIRGVDPKAEVGVSPVLGELPLGTMEDLGLGTVLLGHAVASWLGVTLGDEVRLTFPRGESSTFRVVGVFDSGVAQYDNSFVYICLSQMQELLELPQGVGEIRIALKDPFLADSIAESLRGPDLNLETITWRELNRSLFDALVLEKRVFALVLSLMLVVAGFGIANALGMHVMQRQRDIAILSTMGLSVKRIRYIFILQGVLLGIVGAVMGGALGLAITWSIHTFGLPLPGDIYPVDQVPVEVRLLDVILTMAGAVVISLVASYFPARRISASAPAEVLRYG